VRELWVIEYRFCGTGPFERYMASLRSSEIIEYAGAKSVKAASWLFLE
jgi:hypothetical protein